MRLNIDPVKKGGRGGLKGEKKEWIPSAPKYDMEEPVKYLDNYSVFVSQLHGCICPSIISENYYSLDTEQHFPYLLPT